VNNACDPGRRLIISAFRSSLLLPASLVVKHELQTMADRSTMTLWPHTSRPIANYMRIFTAESGIPVHHSLKYVVIQSVIRSRGVAGGLRLLALPVLGRQASVLLAACLANRMRRRRSMRMPFFNSTRRSSLFATPWAVALAHCILNVPLAGGSSKARLRGRARSNETDVRDGYSFPRFLVQILVP